MTAKHEKLTFLVKTINNYKWTASSPLHNLKYHDNYKQTQSKQSNTNALKMF